MQSRIGAPRETAPWHRRHATSCWLGVNQLIAVKGDTLVEVVYIGLDQDDTTRIAQSVMQLAVGRV